MVIDLIEIKEQLKGKPADVYGIVNTKVKDIIDYGFDLEGNVIVIRVSWNGNEITKIKC